jgi:hypothetical protein
LQLVAPEVRLQNSAFLSFYVLGWGFLHACE